MAGKTLAVKTVLVFEPQAGGHRANYIRWLTAAAPEHPGCRLVYFTADQVDADTAQRLAMAGRWQKQKMLYRLFRQACEEIHPDHALILELTHLELPLALFGSPVPVSAILFVQYPELPRGPKFFSKHWKTRLLLRRTPIRNLFLLNGEKSCRFLTEHFGARARFIPLADPAPEAAAEDGFSLRQHFSIDAGCRIFLFFGAISRRKGADVLLKALEIINRETAAGAAFVFCGAPEPPYREDFQREGSALRTIRPDVQLCTDEQFVSDERMMALFEQSDVVLMPYTRPEYSSGVLTLAAKAGKPVLGPDSGLLGRLITGGGLGAVSPVSPESLARALEMPICADRSGLAGFYAKNQIQYFSDCILGSLEQE